MRRLLDWTKFGPAGRDYIDWVEGASPLPSTDRQLPDKNWNELTSGEATSTEVGVYIVIATASFLFLGLMGFLVWRRRCYGGKLDVANVIALADLQDPERNVELLSSIRRGREAFPSSSSDPEMTDGVFLMVYLPPPYEQSLTQLARAASITSSRGAEPPARRNRPIQQTLETIHDRTKDRDQDQAQIHDRTKDRDQDQAQIHDRTKDRDQDQAQMHDRTQDRDQDKELNQE